MKISIDIDDSELNEAISKGVKDLSADTITELAKDAVSAYLQTTVGIEKVLYKDRRNAWDAPDLRPEIVKLLENSFTSAEVEAYRARIFKALEERGGNLMVQVLAELFSRMLMTEDVKRDIAVAIASAAKRND